MATNKSLHRIRAIYRLSVKSIKSVKSPEHAARGTAIGLFVAFLPVFGFQFLLAIFLASVLGGHRTLAALGTLVTNPLTALPFTGLAIMLGDWILPGVNLSDISLKELEISQLIHDTSNLGKAFVFGSVLLGIFGLIIGYSGVLLYSRVFLKERSKNAVTEV